jgi:hypothetical protein
MSAATPRIPRRLARSPRISLTRTKLACHTFDCLMNPVGFDYPRRMARIRIANPWLALLRMALRSSCGAEVSNPAVPGHDFSEAGFRASVCCGTSAGVLLRADRNIRPCHPSPSFGSAFDISQRRALMRNSRR